MLIRKTYTIFGLGSERVIMQSDFFHTLNNDNYDCEQYWSTRLIGVTKDTEWL